MALQLFDNVYGETLGFKGRGIADTVEQTFEKVKLEVSIDCEKALCYLNRCIEATGLAFKNLSEDILSEKINLENALKGRVGEIRSLFNKVKNVVSENYSRLTNSTIFRALTPVTKAAKNIQNLVLHVLSKVSEIQPVEIPQSLQTISLVLFLVPLEVATKIKSVISFLNIRKLKPKFIKHFEKLKTAISVGNHEQIVTSALKVGSLCARILDVPEVVNKFLSIFKISLPRIITNNLKFTNLFSFVLAPLAIITKIRDCKFTIKFQRELKREKQIAYMESYLDETENGFQFFREDVSRLSRHKLKKAVCKAEKNLIEWDASQMTLQKVEHAANLRFVKVLNEKIQEKPEIVSKVFKVKFEKKSLSPKLKDERGKVKKAVNENFFEKLSSERMQDRSNYEKLDRAVKVISSRLNHRIGTHCYTIITKSFSWLSSLVGQFETFGIPCNPISPVRIVVDTSISIASLINFFYQVKKQKEFIEDMESLTA